MDILLQIASNVVNNFNVNIAFNYSSENKSRIEEEINSIDQSDIELLVTTLFPGELKVDPNRFLLKLSGYN